MTKFVEGADPLRVGENRQVKLAAERVGGNDVKVTVVIECPDYLTIMWGELWFTLTPNGVFCPNNTSKCWAVGFEGDGPLTSGWAAVELLSQLVHWELERRAVALLLGEAVPPPAPPVMRSDLATDADGWWAVQ